MLLQDWVLMLNLLNRYVSNFRTQSHPKEAIVKCSAPNVDVIPSHIDLVAIEIELVDKENREYMLKKALESIKDEYDYIIIDCVSLGLLTLNALDCS
jgi:chromosome partitioning protein